MALKDYYLPATAFTPDADAQLVALDIAATWVTHKGRPALSFIDGADESAAVSKPFEMPSAWAGGTLKARLFFYSESDATGDFNVEVYVEAATGNADTLDMEAATSWDTVNNFDVALSGTIGDPLFQDLTLTNKDSVAAGDTVRIGLRRDSDDATNDDATGAMFVSGIRLFEA